MYPADLEINDTTESNTSASWLDLLLSIESNGQLRTSLCDKRDDFNFHITNFPYLRSNISSSPAYGDFISQLIRYARACSSYECFILRAARLSSKLIGQEYVLERLTSPSGSFMVDMGISSNIMKSPSPKCYMTFWDMTIYNDTINWSDITQICKLFTELDIITILTLLPKFIGFHRTLQRVRLANRGCLLLRTPGPVPFRTSICSYVETILSWTCHVYGPFQFWVLNIPWYFIFKMLEFLVDNVFVIFAGKVFQQIVGIPMGTKCAPLLADIFVYSYEAEFTQSLLSTERKQLASRFNFTYRYIDDVLSINNQEFENYLGQMYPVELEIKDTTESNTSASYLDLLLSIGIWGTVNFTLPFMTNVTISISTSQIFRSWEAIFQPRPPMASLFRSSYGMPRLAPRMDVLPWGRHDFQISLSKRDTSRNAWNRHWRSFMVDTGILSNNMKFPSYKC